MADKLTELQLRYYQLLDNIPFIREDLDYTILDGHKPYLEGLDRIGNAAISVFDLHQKTHVYISDLYRKRLGLPDDKHKGPEGFDQLMHPDDLLTATKSGLYFLQMMMDVRQEKLRNFKLINEFRIQFSGSKWMRMSEHHQILETDPNGNIWLALSSVDVSSNQNINEPMSSRLVNLQTGEIISFASVESYFQLTDREKEILFFISEGLVSKQIADNLNISIHTVNTHRQNIIHKMDVANTTEAVRMASRMGILA